MMAWVAWLITKGYKCWKLILTTIFILMVLNFVFVMSSKQFSAGELVGGEYGSWV
jgi:hypothetical protein